MKRLRDVYERFRAAGGRLDRTQSVEQNLKLATAEVDNAIAARDLRAARGHATLARKFLTEALETIARLRG